MLSKYFKAKIMSNSKTRGGKVEGLVLGMEILTGFMSSLQTENQKSEVVMFSGENP
jgi:hypothetical protein